MVSNIATQIFSGNDFTDIFINQFDTLRPIGDARVKVVAQNNKTLFEEQFGSDDHIQISNQFLHGTGGFAPEIILISSEVHGTTIIEVSDLRQNQKFCWVASTSPTSMMFTLHQTGILSTVRHHASFGAARN